MIIVAAIAVVFWGVFNIYPQLQVPETSKPKVYPAENHTSIGHNVTVSYTVVDADSRNGTWKVSIEVTDGEEKENAYAITAESILPVGGSPIVGKLDKFAAATKMPVAEFMIGLKDQPLVVGASWQMAFLSPDNTYTRSYIAQKQEVNGEEVYVLKYGPENTPSFTRISKNYPIPLRDEYKDPISGQIISVYALVEYGGTKL